MDYPIDSINGVSIENMSKVQLVEALVENIEDEVNFRVQQTKRSEAQLRVSLQVKLRKNHPLLEELNSISLEELKKLPFLVNQASRVRNDRIRGLVSNYYFSTFPGMPMTSMKKDLQELKSRREEIRQQPPMTMEIVPQGLRFQNPGLNACYIHSSVNILLDNKKVRDFFRSLRNGKEHSDACLACSALKNYLLNSNLPLHSKSIKDHMKEYYFQFNLQGRLIGRPVVLNPFDNFFQQDAQEFLIKFLESCPEILHDLFRIKLCVEYRCSSCGNKRRAMSEVEEYMLFDAINLQTRQSLNQIVEQGRKSLTEGFTCDNCGITCDAERVESITESSDLLLVGVKRFLNDGSKIDTMVEPSLSLQINNVNYILMGIVEHSGLTLKSGHYTSWLRRKQGLWIKTSDMSITTTKEVTKNGYLFLYQKGHGVGAIPEAVTEAGDARGNANEWQTGKRGNNNVNTPKKRPAPKKRRTSAEVEINVPTRNRFEILSDDEMDDVFNKAFDDLANNTTRKDSNLSTDEIDDPMSDMREEMASDMKNTKSRRNSNGNGKKKKNSSVYCPENVNLNREDMLKSLKEGLPFPSIFEDNEVLYGGLNMYEELKDWNMESRCTICEEKWFDLEVCGASQVCKRCNQEKRNQNRNGDTEMVLTFSRDNDMIPSPIPEELRRLNDVEECAIKLIMPFMDFSQYRGGSTSFKGNCISFSQNVPLLAKSLPWSVENLPMIILRSGKNGKVKKFRAGRKNIRDALEVLQKINVHYKNIPLSEDHLRQYPEERDVIEGIEIWKLESTNWNSHRNFNTISSHNFSCFGSFMAKTVIKSAIVHHHSINQVLPMGI